MQSDNDGFGSGGCDVQPTLADVVRSELKLSLREPWFAEAIIDVRSQLKTSLQEPWFAAIIEDSILRHIQHIQGSQIGTASSQSSLSQLSQSSLSSSAGSGDIAAMSLRAVAPILVADVGSQTLQAEGSNPLAVGSSGVLTEANLDWDVPCPCCLKVSPNEAAFVEHIKLIVRNRHLGTNPIIKCVMRETNIRHRQLLSRWTQECSWLDSVCEFVAELRSCCNPGSKRVHRPGGTGNNRKIKKFITQCLSPARHVGDNVSAVARQSPVVVGASLPGHSFVPSHDDLTGSAPDHVDPDDFRLLQFMMQESTDESWNQFLEN